MIELAKLVAERGDEWTLAMYGLHRWHAVASQQVGLLRYWWCIDNGVRLLGEQSVLRTAGKPATLTYIRQTYGNLIANTTVTVLFADGHEDRQRVLAALIATESGRNPKASRWEPQLKDYSFGLTQMLTRTAKAFEQLAGVALPEKPVPAGGDVDQWRAALGDPATAIKLACAYLDYVNMQFNCQGEPMLLYSSYNSGSPRPSKNTPWGLTAYDHDGLGPEPGALDNFARWYGDACAVFV